MMEVFPCDISRLGRSQREQGSCAVVEDLLAGGVDSGEVEAQAVGARWVSWIAGQSLLVFGLE